MEMNDTEQEQEQEKEKKTFTVMVTGDLYVLDEFFI